MTWEKFWSIIDRVRAQADMQDEASVNQFLYTELIKLPQDELLGFDCAWQSYRNKANFPKMVAAACVINDGSSDDRFTDFRNWLIMQGYDAYRQALIDPDNLAALNIPFRDTEWMGCGNVAWYAYAGQNVGFWDSIPLWAVTLIGGLLITVLSFTMILTVYGRMFSLWMYAAIAPIPLSTFAGEPTSSVGKNFIRSYAGVCLQGVVIALSCIIFSAISSSPPAVDTGASVVTAVWTYVGELAFNLLVLVGAIKGCDRIVKEIMGL